MKVLGHDLRFAAYKGHLETDRLFEVFRDTYPLSVSDVLCGIDPAVGGHRSRQVFLCSDSHCIAMHREADV